MLSKQKNFSFSLSFRRLHFLSPYNLLTCVLMALVTQGQKFSSRLSLCVFTLRRGPVCPHFLLSVSAQCNCSPRALRSHLLRELLPLKDRVKKKKKKKVVFPSSFQPPYPLFFAAAKLTLAQSYLQKVKEIGAVTQIILFGFHSSPVCIS